MALSYGFFNAELTQSGQYDRVYAAEQFAEYFHLIVSNGVFPDPATQLQVVASNTPDMNVNVSDGYGWINGYFAKNEGSYPLAIQAASGTLNRVDAVVLRWVNASRSMELAVKTGTPASSPATPVLQRDTDVYEIMLATVTVAAGVTSIYQSAITDKRADTSVCGWVTGAVQNIDTTNLFAQYDAAFQAWFEDIQSQLSGDVATNLQNQINQRLKISDRATEQEAINGVSNSKWLSPATGKAITSIDHVFPIGSILSTIKSTLGDKWLLCNGTEYQSDKYPVLDSLIDPGIPDSLLSTTGSISSMMEYIPNGMKYVNGYYVIIDGSNEFLYSNSINGTFTRKSMNGNVRDLAYIQGKYVAVVWIDFYGYLAYSDSINGTYTQYKIATDYPSYATSIVASEKFGKIYVSNGEAASILYAYNIGDSFTKKTIGLGSSGQWSQIKECGNYLFFWGSSSSICGYSSDGDTFNSMSISGVCLGIEFDPETNQYIMVSLSSTTMYVYFGNPVSGWTSKTITVPLNFSYHLNNNIAIVSGFAFVLGRAQGNTSPWFVKIDIKNQSLSLDVLTDYSFNYYVSLIVNNNVQVFGVRSSSGSSGNYTVNYTRLNGPIKSLPLINLGRVNTFIKALEG